MAVVEEEKEEEEEEKEEEEEEEMEMLVYLYMYLCKVLLALLFALFPACHLYMIGCQAVQSSHLVLLKVTVADISICEVRKSNKLNITHGYSSQ